MSNRERRLRICMGPLEVAGYYANLAAGFQALGWDVTLLTTTPHAFGYADMPPRSKIARAALKVARASDPGARKGIHRVWAVPLHVQSRALLAVHAAFAYDVMVFSVGQTWLFGFDLPLLKLLGKKAIFIFHGSDSRAPYINGKIIRQTGGRGAALAARTRRIRRRLNWVARWADAIVDNPLSGHLHVRPFVNWFQIGIPVKPRASGSVKDTEARTRLRVVHAPSDPASKGTALIVAAVERAQARGVPIDFVQIVGKPNSEVLAELALCDFVIDELYSDVPGAGLAFEAAAFGKPTIVGGYAADELRRWVPPNCGLPTLYIHPAELDEAIDKLACDSQLRSELGERARRFVEETCRPEAVASRLAQVIEGGNIAEWMVDPNDITYLHGAGITEERVRAAISAVLEAGSNGLQLADRDSLARRFKAFAAGLPLPSH